jgi:spore maturation protein B
MEYFKLTLDWASIAVIPLILLLFLGMAYFKKVKVYERFVEGAKEGFQIGVKIIPYLVAMLVAIAMFRASGALEILTYVMKPFTELIGMPSEVLPMALMRPLSGSGSLGVMTELMKTHGADSLIGFMSSTMFGSTETTFYVIAVYFGAVNIQKTRYALPAGLIADVAGLLAAALICTAIF